MVDGEMLYLCNMCKKQKPESAFFRSMLLRNCPRCADCHNIVRLRHVPAGTADFYAKAFDRLKTMIGRYRDATPPAGVNSTMIRRIFLAWREKSVTGSSGDLRLTLWDKEDVSRQWDPSNILPFTKDELRARLDRFLREHRIFAVLVRCELIMAAMRYERIVANEEHDAMPEEMGF